MKKYSNSFRLTAIVLLLLTGLNAIVAGYLFIADPSGQKMGMTTNYLQFSPFSNYLIPGVVLFLVNGVLNIIAAAMAIKKHRLFPVLTFIQGALLTGWIAVQVIMVKDFNALHLIMGTIGLILMFCGGYLYSPKNDKSGL